MNERITERARAFIAKHYADAAGQAELKTAVDILIEDPERKADLLKPPKKQE